MSRQSVARLRRSGEEGEPLQALEQLVERLAHFEGSQEALLEEMSRCLLEVRQLFKQSALGARVPLSGFLDTLQRLASERALPPEKVCTTLLERLLLDGEGEEGGKAGLKRSTKDRILDAALEVFSERGFHSATVDEIAERAGVGKGTLYRYFANKETLFNELIRLRLEELEGSATAVLDGRDDVLTMITKYLRVYFEFFDRNQRLYRLIAQERPDVGEHVQDLYFKKVMRRVPLLKRKIYEASQQGVLKDVDFQTVFYGVMGFIHGVIQKWLSRDCAYPLVDELPGVVEVLFYGFVNNSEILDRQENPFRR